MNLSISFRKTPRALAAAVFVVAALAGSAIQALPGDDDAPASYLQVKGALVPARVHRGGSARADVAVKVEKGYHIQSHKPLDDSYVATALTWEKPRPGIRIGAPDFPRAIARKTTFDERPLPMHEGAFFVRTRVTVARTVPPGTYMLKGTLHYQACSDEACYAPRSEQITIPVTVVK